VDKTMKIECGNCWGENEDLRFSLKSVSSHPLRTRIK